MNQSTTLTFCISLIIVCGFLLAGCGNSTDIPANSKQSMTVFSLQPEGENAINFGYSSEKGWHLEETLDIQPTKMPSSGEFETIQQSVVMQGGLPGGNPGAGGAGNTGQGGNNSGPGFGSLGKKLADNNTGRFQSPDYTRAYVAGYTGQGFSSSSRYSNSFQSPNYTPKFNGGIATGGNCNLSGLCDFMAVMCSAFQGIGTGKVQQACGRSVAQCRSSIRVQAASLPPAARSYLCVLSDFFSCLGDVYRRGVQGTQGFDVCATSAAQGFIKLAGQQLGGGK